MITPKQFAELVKQRDALLLRSESVEKLSTITLTVTKDKVTFTTEDSKDKKRNDNQWHVDLSNDSVFVCPQAMGRTRCRLVQARTGHVVEQDNGQLYLVVNERTGDLSNFTYSNGLALLPCTLKPGEDETGAILEDLSIGEGSAAIDTQKLLKSLMDVYQPTREYWTSSLLLPADEFEHKGRTYALGAVTPNQFWEKNTGKGSPYFECKVLPSKNRNPLADERTIVTPSTIDPISLNARTVQYTRLVNRIRLALERYVQLIEIEGTGSAVAIVNVARFVKVLDPEITWLSRTTELVPVRRFYSPAPHIPFTAARLPNSVNLTGEQNVEEAWTIVATSNWPPALKKLLWMMTGRQVWMKQGESEDYLVRGYDMHKVNIEFTKTNADYQWSAVTDSESIRKIRAVLKEVFEKQGANSDAIARILASKQNNWAALYRFIDDRKVLIDGATTLLEKAGDLPDLLDIPAVTQGTVNPGIFEMNDRYADVEEEDKLVNAEAEALKLAAEKLEKKKNKKKKGKEEKKVRDGKDEKEAPVEEKGSAMDESADGGEEAQQPQEEEDEEIRAPTQPLYSAAGRVIANRFAPMAEVEKLVSYLLGRGNWADPEFYYYHQLYVTLKHFAGGFKRRHVVPASALASIEEQIGGALLDNLLVEGGSSSAEAKDTGVDWQFVPVTAQCNIPEKQLVSGDFKLAIEHVDIQHHPWHVYAIIRDGLTKDAIEAQARAMKDLTFANGGSALCYLWQKLGPSNSVLFLNDLETQRLYCIRPRESALANVVSVQFKNQPLPQAFFVRASPLAGGHQLSFSRWPQYDIRRTNTAEMAIRVQDKDAVIVQYYLGLVNNEQDPDSAQVVSQVNLFHYRTRNQAPMDISDRKITKETMAYEDQVALEGKAVPGKLGLYTVVMPSDTLQPAEYWSAARLNKMVRAATISQRPLKDGLVAAERVYNAQTKQFVYTPAHVTIFMQDPGKPTKFVPSQRRKDGTADHSVAEAIRTMHQVQDPKNDVFLIRPENTEWNDAPLGKPPKTIPTLKAAKMFDFENARLSVNQFYTDPLEYFVAEEKRRVFVFFRRFLRKSPFLDLKPEDDTYELVKDGTREYWVGEFISRNGLHALVKLYEYDANGSRYVERMHVRTKGDSACSWTEQVDVANIFHWVMTKSKNADLSEVKHARQVEDTDLIVGQLVQDKIKSSTVTFNSARVIAPAEQQLQLRLEGNLQESRVCMFCYTESGIADMFSCNMCRLSCHRVCPSGDKIPKRLFGKDLVQQKGDRHYEFYNEVKSPSQTLFLCGHCSMYQVELLLHEEKEAISVIEDDEARRKALALHFETKFQETVRNMPAIQKFAYQLYERTMDEKTQNAGNLHKFFTVMLGWPKGAARTYEQAIKILERKARQDFERAFATSMDTLVAPDTSDALFEVDIDALNKAFAAKNIVWKQVLLNKYDYLPVEAMTDALEGESGESKEPDVAKGKGKKTKKTAEMREAARKQKEEEDEKAEATASQERDFVAKHVVSVIREYWRTIENALDLPLNEEVLLRTEVVRDVLDVYVGIMLLPYNATTNELAFSNATELGKFIAETFKDALPFVANAATAQVFASDSTRDMVASVQYWLMQNWIRHFTYDSKKAIGQQVPVVALAGRWCTENLTITGQSRLYCLESVATDADRTRLANMADFFDKEQDGWKVFLAGLGDQLSRVPTADDVLKQLRVTEKTLCEKYISPKNTAVQSYFERVKEAKTSQLNLDRAGMLRGFDGNQLVKQQVEEWVKELRVLSDGTRHCRNEIGTVLLAFFNDKGKAIADKPSDVDLFNAFVTAAEPFVKFQCWHWDVTQYLQRRLTNTILTADVLRQMVLAAFKQLKQPSAKRLGWVFDYLYWRCLRAYEILFTSRSAETLNDSALKCLEYTLDDDKGKALNEDDKEDEEEEGEDEDDEDSEYEEDEEDEDYDEDEEGENAEGDSGENTMDISDDAPSGKEEKKDAPSDDAPSGKEEKKDTPITRSSAKNVSKKLVTSGVLNFQTRSEELLDRAAKESGQGNPFLDTTKFGDVNKSLAFIVKEDISQLEQQLLIALETPTSAGFQLLVAGSSDATSSSSSSNGSSSGDTPMTITGKRVPNLTGDRITERHDMKATSDEMRAFFRAPATVLAAAKSAAGATTLIQLDASLLAASQHRLAVFKIEQALERAQNELKQGVTTRNALGMPILLPPVETRSESLPTMPTEWVADFNKQLDRFVTALNEQTQVTNRQLKVRLADELEQATRTPIAVVLFNYRMNQVANTAQLESQVAWFQLNIALAQAKGPAYRVFGERLKLATALIAQELYDTNLAKLARTKAQQLLVQSRNPPAQVIRLAQLYSQVQPDSKKLEQAEVALGKYLQAVTAVQGEDTKGYEELTHRPCARCNRSTNYIERYATDTSQTEAERLLPTVDDAFDQVSAFDCHFQTHPHCAQCITDAIRLGQHCAVCKQPLNAAFRRYLRRQLKKKNLSRAHRVKRTRLFQAVVKSMRQLNLENHEAETNTNWWAFWRSANAEQNALVEDIVRTLRPSAFHMEVTQASGDSSSVPVNTESYDSLLRGARQAIDKLDLTSSELVPWVQSSSFAYGKMDEDQQRRRLHVLLRVQQSRVNSIVENERLLHKRKRRLVSEYKADHQIETNEASARAANWQAAARALLRSLPRDMVETLATKRSSSSSTRDQSETGAGFVEKAKAAIKNAGNSISSAVQQAKEGFAAYKAHGELAKAQTEVLKAKTEVLKAQAQAAAATATAPAMFAASAMPAQQIAMMQPQQMMAHPAMMQPQVHPSMMQPQLIHPAMMQPQMMIHPQPAMMAPQQMIGVPFSTPVAMMHTGAGVSTSEDTDAFNWMLARSAHWSLAHMDQVVGMLSEDTFVGTTRHEVRETIRIRLEQWLAQYDSVRLGPTKGIEIGRTDDAAPLAREILCAFYLKLLNVHRDGVLPTGAAVYHGLMARENGVATGTDAIRDLVKEGKLPQARQTLSRMRECGATGADVAYWSAFLDAQPSATTVIAPASTTTTPEDETADSGADADFFLPAPYVTTTGFDVIALHRVGSEVTVYSPESDDFVDMDMSDLASRASQVPADLKDSSFIHPEYFAKALAKKCRPGLHLTFYDPVSGTVCKNWVIVHVKNDSNNKVAQIFATRDASFNDIRVVVPDYIMSWETEALADSTSQMWTVDKSKLPLISKAHFSLGIKSVM